MALLDVDVERELAGRLGVRSVPTVYGVWEGRIVDRMIDLQPSKDVEIFVSKLEALSEPEEPFDPLAAASDAMLAGNAPLALEIARAEIDAVRGEPTTKRCLSKEFDADMPESQAVAWLLQVVCRAEIETGGDATATLASLRDPKRSAVIAKDPALKAAVAELALALAEAPDGDDFSQRLADARAAFADGRQALALDLALGLVTTAPHADAKEQARRLVLDFIDALGPSPEAANARRRLSNAIFR